MGNVNPLMDNDSGLVSTNTQFANSSKVRKRNKTKKTKSKIYVGKITRLSVHLHLLGNTFCSNLTTVILGLGLPLSLTSVERETRTKIMRSNILLNLHKLASNHLAYIYILAPNVVT